MIVITTPLAPINMQAMQKACLVIVDYGGGKYVVEKNRWSTYPPGLILDRENMLALVDETLNRIETDSPFPVGDAA